ncbi:transglutaminase-like domain-containing protein [Paenibacillus sp. ACRRX]|uniref:transglutaminase-like domain-containing protein n=1 Tax=Paenibacillus sp. ACRRX TaxID=2918206 RepID=UPI001EF66070|nr:transglutaminase-like domain-containing protein [Paenibacillus sp. ACRRX]MCG7408483.1 transglutaminase-like domain-containing protein [Paenibacillus sp. ACRRX]
MNTAVTYGIDQMVLEQKLVIKMEWAQHRRQALFGILDHHLTEEETILLKVLYAYMPLNDLADYDGAFFLDHVRQALKVREELPWGSAIPDSIFLNFVLPYRVNNENIDDSRKVIYGELAERVRGLSMYDAILETNYWCHERATYIGTDMRTVSPLTLMRTALGRCGEQSTLAVAALRSIGIPARQCYTPRWAHCDSNHAWVEAWADGRWHFLGACEPEPKLDEGWFRSPSRRAMLVNTRVSADYNGPEEICSDHPWYAEINMLDNYAPVKQITVQVVDAKGAPVEAEVHFQLYNYAEFYSIVTKKTNAAGQVTLKTGLGDLLLHVRNEQGFGVRKISVTDTDTFEVKLHASTEQMLVQEWSMVPPPVTTDMEECVVSEEAKRRHEARVKEGTAIRAAFEGTFYSEQQAMALAQQLGLASDRVWVVLEKAKGNSGQIAAFLLQECPRYGDLPLRLLESLRDKDLADTCQSTLADHLYSAAAYADQGVPAGLFDPYVLCPRIHFEMIAPYREQLLQSLSEVERHEYISDPQLLITHIKDSILIVQDVDRYTGMMTPAGVHRMKVTDRMSREIYFVAMARSLGIPARLEPLNLSAQYWLNEQWQEARFETVHAPLETSMPARSSIVFVAAEQHAELAAYQQTFTIARLEDGMYRTLSIPFGEKDVYGKPYEVLSGSYRVTTGTRLSDGTVLVRCSYFTVKPNETVHTTLIFRQENESVPVLGEVSEDTITCISAGVMTELPQAGIILAWLDPEREPSKHLMREMRELQLEFDSCGSAVLLLARNEEAVSSIAMKGLPAAATAIRDSSYEGLKLIQEDIRMIKGSEFPIVVVLDAKRQLRYVSEGYKLGIGTEIVKTVRNMKIE